MSRPLFDRGSFGSRQFDSAFRDIFGITPRTVGEAEADDADELPDHALPALPVSQADGE